MMVWSGLHSDRASNHVTTIRIAGYPTAVPHE